MSLWTFVAIYLHKRLPHIQGGLLAKYWNFIAMATGIAMPISASIVISLASEDNQR
jgi:hypothetical protein